MQRALRVTRATQRFVKAGVEWGYVGFHGLQRAMRVSDLWESRSNPVALGK
jgi:hypothetical protein